MAALPRLTSLALLICLSTGLAPGQTGTNTCAGQTTCTIYMTLWSANPIENNGQPVQHLHVEGCGVPGNESADGGRGFFLASLNPGPVTAGALLPANFIGESGQPSLTTISMIVRYNADTLFFVDHSPTWDNSGRSGTAKLVAPTGSFHDATGSFQYNLKCNQGCPMDPNDIVFGSFDGYIAGTATLTLPAAIVMDILPSLFLPLPPPSPNTPAPAQQPGVAGKLQTATSTAGKVYTGSGSTGSGSTDSRPVNAARLAISLDASSQSFGTPFLSVTPTMEVAPVTYNATATCSNLPTGCWVSVPSPSGSIDAFDTASIIANFNPPADLVAGVYPADLAVAITSDPTMPPVVQDSPTVLILGDAPALSVSEKVIAFQALAGQGSQPTQSHTVMISSPAGQSFSYTAAESTLSGGSWLSISASSGLASPTSSLTISANPSGLPAGSYFGRVDVASSGASSSPQSVFVHFTIAASGKEPMLATNALIFVVPQNSTTVSKSMQITSYSPSAIPIRASSEQDLSVTWFSIFYTAFSVSASAPVTLTVTVNPAGLTPGPYTGTVSVQNSSDLSIYQVSILLVVTPPGGQCTPTQLLPMLTSLGAGFDVPSAVPVSVQAQIIDDCGAPLTSGVAQATFAPDGTSTVLLPVGAGLWAGAWLPHNTAGGPAAVSINAQSSSGLQGAVTVTGNLDTNPTAPIINSGGVVSAASFSPTIVAPGEFISIFGSNLGPATPAEAQPPYPAALGGVQVLLGGQPLPLQVVSSGQINALVPYGTAVNGTQQVVVVQAGAYSMPEDVVVATAQPAVFTQSQTGQGPGAIVVVKADGTQFLNTSSQPAGAGDALVIYCEGLGAVSPAVADGVGPPSLPLSWTVAPVTVTVGGQPAQVLFSGLAPGYAGLYQVNVVVPSGVSSGSNAPVVVTAGGFPGPPVTVAIQ